MNNLSDLFRGIGNLIRSINYARLAFFVIIGLIAVLQYIQTQSPSAAVEGALAILGILKNFLPSGTVKLPSGEVVTTAKITDSTIDDLSGLKK